MYSTNKRDVRVTDYISFLYILTHTLADILGRLRCRCNPRLSRVVGKLINRYRGVRYSVCIVRQTACMVASSVVVVCEDDFESRFHDTF